MHEEGKGPSNNLHVHAYHFSIFTEDVKFAY